MDMDNYSRRGIYQTKRGNFLTAFYDVEAKTNVSADASAHGIGAILMQQQQGLWQPVAFASRALNKAETCYAQIEKEALALTWALEKFSEYVCFWKECYIRN